MDRETATRGVAMLCAVALLFAPINGRTRWISDGRSGNIPEGYIGDYARPTPTFRSDGGQHITDGAGWDWVLPPLGVAAVIALVAGDSSRSRRAAAVAVIAFGLAAYAAGSYWRAIARNEFQLLGSPKHSDVDPAPGPPWFTAIAVTGLVATVRLASCWRPVGVGAKPADC